MGTRDFSWDNFAGEFYRAEIVKTFDTLEQGQYVVVDPFGESLGQSFTGSGRRNRGRIANGRQRGQRASWFVEWSWS